MHFGLSEEQLAMRDMARRFAEERLAPRYREREAEACIEPELIEEMGALGLIGVDLPEPLGGLDLGGVASGLIIEDIAGGDMNVSYVQLLASLNGSIIAAHARPGGRAGDRSPDLRGEGARRPRAHRAGRGLRRRQPQAPGRAHERRVRPQRREGVDLARHPGARGGHLRPHRGPGGALARGLRLRGVLSIRRAWR